MLDTSGALTMGILLFGYLALRRRMLIDAANGPLTTLGLSFTTPPHQSRSVRRLIHGSRFLASL
jgi:hypothetical protein